MTMPSWLAMALCLLVPSGDGSQPARRAEDLAAAVDTATKPEALDPSPPTMRLPATAKPLRYALDLTVVPEAESFSGTVDVDLELREATSLVWLHAKDLVIEATELTVTGATLPARVIPGRDDFLGLRFERGVGPGPARLRIAYQGRFNETDTRGLFKQKEGGETYVFTQLEATSARRAFPCFDEPSLKVPWQLTLHVRKEHVAVSNTPIVQELDGEDGMKTVKFAETKPLPSYLVAMAVGPFEMLQGSPMGKKGTPLRIVTPRGRAQEGRYAAEITPEIFRRLEAYFGIAYPFEKLDLVAIPQTVGFGAMENPGMITCNQSRLLGKLEEMSIEQKRGLASVMAHEVAHQWFGDLVTMTYWDDVWLNESFATWAGSKIVEAWKPEWEGEVRRAGSRAFAIDEDSLVAARKIRQPIETVDDIENAFDTITYAKGATVLSMFEGFMGADRFKKGVQRYVSEHAFGNASAGDFLSALSAAGGNEIASAFTTFLDQAGVPLVTAELRCEAGGPARLALSQKRFLPIGSTGSAEQLWQIPVCVRYAAGGRAERACTLMTGRSAELTLRSGNGCPEWVLANDGERGYYLVSYRGDLRSRLLSGEGVVLTLPERVGVLDDVRALARAGELSMAEALAMVASMASGANRHVVSRAAKIVSGLEDHFVPEPLRPNYARFVRRMFGERARELGLAPRSGEDDGTKLLRSDLVPVVANIGEEGALRVEARKLALRWLEDRRAVDADIAGDVLHIAALDGDRALFERLRAAAKKTSDRRDRRRLLRAMGSFRDPEVVNSALSLVLSDEFDVKESMRILWAALEEPRAREVVYDFVKRNFDALAERIPSESGASLFSMPDVFCDEDHRQDAARFFRERVARFPGAPRNLDQALEAVSLCIAMKRAQQQSVAAFLATY